MIIVTGGAGFVGSNLVRGLNEKGLDNILVVDDLTDGDKCRNIQDCQIADFIDKDDFIKRVKRDDLFGQNVAIYHQGACSDTMETDGRYMMKNNFEYSKHLFHYAAEHSVPFIYASSASVYGGGTVFKEETKYEQALNAYAYSKLLFDRYVRKHKTDSQVVGLRYFNVYGRGESHKGRMASVAYHFFNQFLDNGYVKLFEASDGYADGEQLRDFVWVKDVIDVNLHFLEHPDTHGIFNVGTGRAQSFNDVATATLNAMTGEKKTTKQWADEKIIQYIPFPEALIGKYQAFTKADLTELTVQGDYQKSFAKVEEGVGSYVQYLKDHIE